MYVERFITKELVTFYIYKYYYALYIVGYMTIK
nr:MAG TPA: hypothetical protein [Caudoviricetes sp.]